MGKVAVIGGGIAGCMSALKLANAGHQVNLLELRDGLLDGSSNGTACRLSAGFHFFDKITAKKCLRATVQFLRQYPDFVLGGDRPRHHPYRRTRYFVMHDSLFSFAKIKNLHDMLSAEYNKLIQKDPKNKVFGEAEHFSVLLKPEQYQQDVDVSQVQACFDTAEQILNWPALKKSLIEQLRQHPGITIMNNTQVIDVSRHQDELGFELMLQNNLQPCVSRLDTDFVVNASWYNIDFLNQKVGIPVMPESRTHRLKMMIRVKLPAGFDTQASPKSHMFFCFGPHCAFTNFIDGTAFITYEPVTNIETSNSLQLPALSERLLNGHTPEEEKQHYARGIMEGVARYIPALAGMEFLDVRFGIVKTPAITSLSDPNSAMHARRESGVNPQFLGWVDNASMKLLYGFSNADKVLRIINQYEREYQKIRKSNREKTLKTVLSAPVLSQSRQRQVSCHVPQE